ncbi:MAG: tRNA 2-thiouridine(34) synthase MnmA [Clostridiales bacterium]|nr:tRNA 2-thiouridine(34) synthase MnmA [Clostridiales bacterium]
MEKRVLLGMSGGLDSSYSAMVLAEDGYTVEGAVLKMHDDTDVAAAQEVADSLGISLRVIDCRERFENCVVNNFIEEYAKGRTPNPCVRCNSEVKFDLLCRTADEAGIPYVATGHYARLAYIKETGRYCIERAADLRKDQSYVLWRLEQQQLARLIFPLGTQTKEAVRIVARERRLSSADRPESQEICFIPDGDYVQFIEQKKGPFTPGDFIDINGKRVGQHKGIIRYTIGQRKGLGLSMGEPVFVGKIDPIENTVTVVPSEFTYSNRLFVEELNFSGMHPMQKGKKQLYVKLRYLAPLVLADVTFCSGGAYVFLHMPARAVTPGQSAVFYEDNRIAFGGIISGNRSIPDENP